MAVVPSRYTVRITPREGATYHDVTSLASRVAEQNPGLTIEVVEDKVWMRVTTTGGKSGS